ncbi:hypothetical protein FRC04_001853 [Tulasnella sp. 424]|nr:hypothetical protein FRC04_001853 [Tulasnella sp. 424]
MAKKGAAPVKSSKAAAPVAKGKAKAQPAKPAKKLAPPPPSDTESSSEEEEEEPKSKAKPANGKAAPKKASKKSESESESGSDSDSSESEDDKAVVPAAKKAVEATTVAAKAIGKVGANAAKAAVPAAKAVVSAVTSGVTSKEGNKESSSSSESGSESSDDDSDGSSVAGKAKAAANAAAAKVNGGVAKAKDAAATTAKKAEAKAKSDSESSSESDDSDEDGDAPMKDASKPPKASKVESKPNGLKRKAEDDQSDSSKKPRPDAEGSTTIFVGRLSFNVDDDWLKSEFDQYGTVTSSRVIIHKDTGKSKGFGYVTFETAEAAQAALERSGQEIDGRPINVDLANPTSAPGDRPERPARRNSDFGSRGNGSPQKPTGPATSTLFVGNLPFSATEDQVWEKFADFGSVSSVRLPTDRETGQPKGFGYVEFLNVESAQKAVDNGASLEIDGRTPRLDFSQPRDSNGGGRGAPRGRGGPRGGSRGGFGGGSRGGFGGGSRGGFGGGRGRGAGGSRYFAPPAGRKTTFD